METENIERPPVKKQRLSIDEEDTLVDDEPEFPTTLEGFGYKFEEGRLKHVETGEPFVFQESEKDHQYNQDRYEALGNVITDYIYGLLVTDARLKKLAIPVDASTSEATTFIFHSEDAFTNRKLIVLIHGCGAVRAGQWARRLIINDSLDSGTQIPFIKKARELNYGVIVLNTNDNKQEVDGSIKKVRGSEDATNHAFYVWETIIDKAAAKHIAFVAHSFGGIVTVNLCNAFQSCREKVFAIAFTDSPHSLYAQKTPISLINWFMEVARNWVSNPHPLDTPITRGTYEEVKCFSAGTQKHELTSWASFDSIFKYIEVRYDIVTTEEQPEGERKHEASLSGDQPA